MVAVDIIAVDDNGQQNHNAGDDLLIVSGDSQKVHTIIHNGNDENTNDRRKNAPGTACIGSTANNNCCDSEKIVRFAGCRTRAARRIPANAAVMPLMT